MFSPFVTFFYGEGLAIDKGTSLHDNGSICRLDPPHEAINDVICMAWSTVCQANTHLDDVSGGFCVFAEADQKSPCSKSSCSPCWPVGPSLPIPSHPSTPHVSARPLGEETCLGGIDREADRWIRTL